MIEILFLFISFLSSTFLYAYLKEKTNEKGKIPFHKERLK